MNASEEKDLSIDTPQGLQEFLHFINDVYRDFLVALQQTSGSEVLVNGDLLAVETAKRKAEELVLHHTKVLEFGGALFEEDIRELQTLYDTIASAYDRLVAAPAPALDTETAYEAIRDTSSFDATIERAKVLAVHADELVYEFGELETVKAHTPELKLGKLLFEQLKATAHKTLMMVGEIEQHTATASPEDVLLVAAQIDKDLDALSETLEQLKQSLLRFFETDDFAHQSPERKNAEDVMKKNERAAKLFDQTSIFSDVLTTLLKEQDNRQVLQSRYSSPAAFEAALKRELYRIEAPSRLDSLLGVKHASAFDFLRDMSLREIDEFDSQARETIREILNNKNIPYEMYVTWMSALPYLESHVAAHDDMTLLELFVRSEIELLRIEQTVHRNSQGVHNR